MKNMNLNLKKPISFKITALVLVLAMVLGMPVPALADQNPVELAEGPTVMKDPDSPTGYTVRFVYKNEDASRVTFVGDMLLRNWADPTDMKVYTPSEYKPGLMRGGGAYEAEMEKRDGGYWVIEVPLAAGANQYWFYVDGNRDYWVPDPANSPKFAPDGLTGNARRAFNAVYVPYDPAKQDEVMGAREIENPRTDGKTGTWSYVPIPTQIGGKTRYLGVYLPYGYDKDRVEPYKTIYLQHGSGQDASDWMNIGSVPNIMDNLLADGLTEPAIVVTTDSTYLGNANAGYPNLFNIILPFIEDNYNVSKNAVDRSFAGLSMGGSITANIINYDASTFGYFGVWSLGVGVRTNAKNLGFPNILFAGGQYDFGLPNPTQLAALDATDAKYKNLVVAGGHDFNTWNQLFTMYARDYLWKPKAFEKLAEGPTVMKDPDSPTGYTVRFVYKNEDASRVTFVGDMLLRNWADPTDTKVYTPSEYKPGLMRGGGAYEAEMEKRDGGYWVIEVPLAAGANQYWFYVDGNRNYWVPDPANSPKFAPDGLTGNARRAFNAVYVPYDPAKQDEVMGAREIENPRTDGKTGTWSYVPIPTQIGGKTRYLGVYLPYGYDKDRVEPYKTIYLQHGSGQDASDWMNIGSVPNIMDNLLADGLTEPAIVVTTDSTYLGNANAGYPNLFNIILPFIEDNYNVSKNAADRSFAGLSMGGGITANLINYDASTFGYFGVWSAGVGIRANANNLESPYILIGAGQYDFGLPNPTQLAALDATDAKYKNLVVAGGHDFNTWNQLFAMYARDYLWKPKAFEKLAEGPTVMKDPDSPTGYTVRFVYKNEDASRVTFVGDMLLRNWADPTDTKVYTPSEYKPGLMRGGGAYEAEMEKRDGGYWVIEVPLAAGANQYWFYVDGNRDYWVPDPANSPKFAPDGLTGNARRAFNAVYVPYDPAKQDEVMGAREIENPRTDGKTGTWSYVPIPTQIGGKTRYLGVYLPYGYDKDRVEPYKTIYMQHGGGQDASDWMNIGSVPNIMDNLLADGLTESAIVVTTDTTYLGSANAGYPNLFNIVLPFIEDNYNVSKNAADRSFAGLSAGGIVTANLINFDATKFGYYGVWSGGVGVRANAVNLDVPYILFAGGRYDFGLPNPNQLAALDGIAKYKYLVVAGGHDFNAWNQLFTMYARDYLWKPKAFIDNSAILTGPRAVDGGQSFDVEYSLAYSGQDVTAQDITINYDADKLEFVSMESLQQDFKLVGNENTDGKLRIIAVNIGNANMANGLIKLKFKAADADNSQIASIRITQLTVANGAGQETDWVGATHTVQINKLDKSGLLLLIAEAQSVHDAAVEGVYPGQYPSGSKATLQDAINAAQAVASTEGVSQAEIEAATLNLNAALQSFKDSKIKAIEGDFNNDNKVSIGDLALLAAAYGKNDQDSNWNEYRRYDLNGDGKIDIVDLSILARKILN